MHTAFRPLTLPALTLPAAIFLATSILVIPAVQAAEDRPEVLDPRLKITRFAEQPVIVTPTGIDVDVLGRVWVLESNTHFPPDTYARHPSDRLHVMRDTTGDGVADRTRIFADGFTHAMSVAVRHVAGDEFAILVATRAAILRLHDDDGDGTCDRRVPLVRLETKGDYPHNGLAGFAFDGLGWMVFGLGENLGAPYRLIGSDGASYAGGGEGGNVYRCRPDGSRMSRLATGFWNPHASCFDALGRLFTVDNDPDSRPPCRLLHVIAGGDYGYRFRNGRKGLHPFTAWDGEVPGTLPMVAGTGEAPSGIVAYESDGLPDDYRGNLLVTSWGDHRIDRFRLERRGASFAARSEPIVRGGEDFRPVGLAVAPDGSLYFTDWVKRDYKLHGHGRVWRIAAAAPRAGKVSDAEVLNVSAIDRTTAPDRCRQLLGSHRLEVRRAAARALAATAPGRKVLAGLLAKPPEAAELAPKRVRVEALWALASRESSTQGAEFPRPDLNEIPAWHRAALRAAPDEVAAAAQRLLEEPGGAAGNGSDEVPLAVSPRQVPRLARPVPLERQAADGGLLRATIGCLRLTDLQMAEPFLTIPDPFLFTTAVRQLARHMDPATAAGPSEVEGPPESGTRLSMLPPRVRLGWLLALRQRDPHRAEFLPRFLQDPDPEVRRAAVQWAAEERLTRFRSEVESVLASGAVNADVLLATLAALQMLDGVAPQDLDKTPPREFLWGILNDAERPATLRALALRMLPANDPELTAPQLGELLRSDFPILRREAAITLGESTASGRDAMLRELAGDAKRERGLRLEAIGGLAIATDRGQAEANRGVLLKLLEDDDAELQREALRSLRGALRADESSLRSTVRRRLAPSEAPSESAERLAEALAVALGQPAAAKDPTEFESGGTYGAGGDVQAGRRLFFHPYGPGCAKCHTATGRGGAVGPDLSVIARTMDRRKLAESMWQPSKEISPQFTNWLFVTEDGRQHSGMILEEDAGAVRIGTAEGRVVSLPTDRIERRRPQRISVMPAGLPDLMTTREMRDLLAFLETLR